MKAVTAITDECILICSHENISIQVIDPSNAAMVSVIISPESFEKFDVTDVEIGIDVREVIVKASTFSPDTILSVSFDDHSKRIVIVGEGARYGIRTMPPESMYKVPTLPELDLPLKVEIDATVLRQMLKRAGLVSDHLALGYDSKRKFFVLAKGDIDDFEQNTAETQIVIRKESDLISLYSIEMLEPMTKIATGDVNLSLGRDLPLTMRFEIDDIEVIYLLAPRIEKEAN
jgi:DNA polymerase III sliding clamp (beta) subunit (PCNA family)